VSADISSLPAGVYFCVLRTEGRSVMKVLVKK
jgi:hypothetical protein